MTVLTTIVAPRGALSGVLDVLRDWSALGVVEPFLWVSAEAVADGEVAALKITNGAAAGTTVQAEAVDRSYDQRRICVLVPVADGAAVVPSAVEQRIAGLLERGGSATRVRVLVTRPGGGQGQAILGQLGWHNVLLSPEDSEGPSKMRITLGAATSTADLGAHAATGVAGILGLWTGVDSSPVEQLPVLPGEYVRLARSFYRRVQTDELENQLRARVTATTAGFPLPHRTGGDCVAIEDVLTYTRGLTDSLFARHPGVLRGSRVASTPVQPVQLGAMAVLRMFFGFLAAAIRNAPMQWYRGTVSKVSSVAARTVHNAVFGQTPAAYLTVVNGMTAQGLPAGWSDWGSAAADLELAAVAASGVPRQRQRTDLSRLWQDFTAAAMTLVDAGDRVAGLGPAEFGSSRGVVAALDDVVPGEASAFAAMPAHLAASIGFAPVRAEDVLAVDLLQRRLQAAATDSGLALDAARAEQDLRDWHNRHRSSFAVQVGSRIAGALRDRQAEIVELLKRLADAAGSGDEEQDELRRQRKLAWRLRLIGIVTVLIIVILCAATGIGILLVPIGLIAVVVLLVAGLGSALLLFVRGQQRLFADLNRRQAAVGQAVIDQQNLIEAFADVRRLTDGYGEFLAWCRAIGGFLALPFGPAPSAPEVASPLTTGFPLSTRIGVAQVDDGALAQAALLLRRGTFTVGWLTEPWTAVLSDAGNRLGAQGFDIRADPQLLFKQPGLPASSLLTRWAIDIESTGPATTSGDRLWAAVIGQLRDQQSDLGDSLLGSISSWGPTGRRSEDLKWFMAGVDQPGTAAGTGFFDDSVLTAQSRTADRAAIHSSIGERAPVGLGWVAALNELSQGLPPYDLTFDAAAAPGPPESPTPIAQSRPAPGVEEPEPTSTQAWVF